MGECHIVSSHTVGNNGVMTVQKGYTVQYHDLCREKNGFVENALSVWKANSSTGDYHSQINFENYEKWLQEKINSKLTPEFCHCY
jgi:hypothetical protein